MFSLFAVIGISLMLSWLLAITVTPMLGHYFFVQGRAGAADAYGGSLFRAYGGLLRGTLRLRWLVVVLLVAVTAACYAGFARVEQQFFPTRTRRSSSSTTSCRRARRSRRRWRTWA